MSWRRFLAITRKEIQHISRDRSTFILVILAPTLILFIMAYAITVEFVNIPVAVLDYDKSSLSRSFITRITAGKDLELFAIAESPDDIERMLMNGEIKAAVIIDPNFSEQIQSYSGFPVQIIIDGTEPQSGGFAVDHIAWRAEEFINQVFSQYLAASNTSITTLQPIDLRVRSWYNPSLKLKVDTIPGLISMVLGFPALSVALALAHEREHRTLEQLMATPITRTELLIGKMIPYIIVGMINVIMMPLLAVYWFKVPFNGNFLLFFFLSGIFMFAILGLGTVVGVFMKTQPAALALAFLVIFFPGFFMTGIFFPITSMPEMVRLESLGLPGTHYAIITRGVFLMNSGLDTLWPYGVMMFGLGLAFVAISALFFRKKLG